MVPSLAFMLKFRAQIEYMTKEYNRFKKNSQKDYGNLTDMHSEETFEAIMLMIRAVRMCNGQHIAELAFKEACFQEYELSNRTEAYQRRHKIKV